jgi:hypothetical protein
MGLKKYEIQEILAMTGAVLTLHGMMEMEDAEWEKDMGLDVEDDYRDELDDEDDGFMTFMGNALMQMANAMGGDGSQGAYNQIPKSQDYFQLSLSWPDRWF